MINIYESYRDVEGNSFDGRTILFLRDNDVDELGNILTYSAGPAVSAEESGRIFIVDDYAIDQIDKLQLIDGILSLKDGEALIPPVKSEKEKMIEELRRQMAELEAMPDEPVDTEENTESQPAE